MISNASDAQVSFGNIFNKINFSQSFKCTNATNIAGTIDKIIGDEGFLESHIGKLKNGLPNDSFSVEHTLLKDAIYTLKYPFIDMPFDIINSFCNFTQKVGLESLGEKIRGTGWISKGISASQSRKSYELVGDIFAQFGAKDASEINDKLRQRFVQSRADKAVETSKNYLSRDERTINRLVTGAIAGILSSVDMYNISMLERNDKTAAKKARKDRFEQEMARIVLSASLTFFNLGALDRYTKGNLLLNAIVVAGSTLLAETFARIVKGRSLVPLSPKQAAKIAQKQKLKNKNSQNEDVKQSEKIINSSKTNQLYKNVISASKEAVPVDSLAAEESKETKKKMSGLTKILIASGVASTVYILLKAVKGEYTMQKSASDMVKKYEEIIKKYLRDEDIDAKDLESILKELKDIKAKGRKLKIADKLEKIKNWLTKKNVNVNIDEVQKEIGQLRGRGFDDVLDVYEKYIDELKKAGSTQYIAKKDKVIQSSIYEGFSRMFITIYNILSLPGAAIDKIFTSLLKYSKSDALIEKLNKKLDKQSIGNYKKQVAKLSELFNEASKKPNKLNEIITNIFGKNKIESNKYDKITQKIKKRIQNFETAAETGKLAHISRTLVTLIASWFYVVDFGNTVLIESEGKNTQRAQEVVNDSIGYKVSNFFFNGALMNMANTLFKAPLNNSLLGAAIVPAVTEVSNEFLIRKTIARPMRKLKSREDVIEYEQKRTNKKGPMGAWTRFYKKLTGQKSLIEKYEAKNNK